MDVSPFVQITGHIPVSMNNVALSARTEVSDLPKCSLFSSFFYLLSLPLPPSPIWRILPLSVRLKKTPDWKTATRPSGKNEFLRESEWDLHIIKAYGGNEARGRAGFQTSDHRLTKRQNKSQSPLDINVRCHNGIIQSKLSFFMCSINIHPEKILLSYV